MTTFGDLNGGLALNPADMGAFTLSRRILRAAGTGETLISRPAWGPSGSNKEKQLAILMTVEGGSFRIKAGDYRKRSATVAANIFTTAAHGFNAGDGPYRLSNIVGLTGVDANTDYYIVTAANTPNTYALATTLAKALAGVIDVVAVGSGSADVGGMESAAAATAADSSGGVLPGFRLLAATNWPAPIPFVMPEQLTVKGSSATDVLTYWFSQS